MRLQVERNPDTSQELPKRKGIAVAIERKLKVRKFTEIPRDEFPLNRATYSRLYDEIGDISARFSDIGTPDGAAVAGQMEAVFASLCQAWEMIRAVERREDFERFQQALPTDTTKPLS